jgi:transposase
MRGEGQDEGAMFSYVTMEQRIPADHPIRGIRRMVDEAMRGMDAAFSAMYARRGRPSIAPERLLRAQLLMVLYSITSERRLMEQLSYNLLFRWFVGLEMDDAVWDATVFSKNRERLIEADVSQQLLLAVVEQARRAVAERRTLHGGRHADPGLGEPAQLPREGRSTGSRHRCAWPQVAARHA